MLTEWKEFSTTLSQFNNAQDVLISLVKHREIFPNLAYIASCLLVIPVHSADCELGFSAMGRIKTKLRSRLCNQSVNSLIFICVEGPHLSDFDFGKLIQNWGRVQETISRRAQFIQKIDGLLDLTHASCMH